MCLQFRGGPKSHETLGPVPNTGKNKFIRIYKNSFSNFLKYQVFGHFFFPFKIMSLILPVSGALNLALNITV